MYLIAIKMLIGDRAKYIMLVSALSFAALLMNQQSSIFIGLMRWTTATLRNTDIPIWVVDPNVEQVNEVKPMRDTDLARVRSVSGVAWALPFYFSLQQARLYDGTFKSIQLLGVDSATLIGAPAVMLEGRVEDLWRTGGVIIDIVGLQKINRDSKQPLKLGDTFDINDNEARIVGICKVEPSFFGYPFVYTTYDRAIEFAPATRRNLSFVLVQPLPGIKHQELVNKIQAETGLRAYTQDDFYWSTIWWFVRNTGIPISFGTTILLGFIVGVAVSGQTFYSFILENLGNLGALKAMGASNKLLARMLLLQAALAGVIGYGIGIGLASIFGYFALEKGQPPFYMPYQVPLITFMAIMLICAFSAFLGIRKISRLEPAEVFRA
jgi:putative ABC transport system permease protein